MVKIRNAALDIIRSVAAITVVVFHVLDSSANNDPFVSEHTFLVVTAITETMKWHVPVFFMITGYLWLDDGKECTYRKMLSNIRRFICVLFTIGFVYAVMERFFTERSISVSLLASSVMDVLSGNLWDHMWYVYSIIGVYLLLPVIKPFFLHSTVKTIGAFISILFVFSLLSPTLQQTIGYEIPVKFPTSSAVFYVCTGGLIAKKKSNSRKSLSCCSILFCCSVAGVFMIKRFFFNFTDWLSLFSCISAICLFITLSSIFSLTTESLYLRTFSDCTFGIYLFHPFFINLMIKALHIYPMRKYQLIAVPVACVSIIALSFMLTYILRRISWIKEYIL